MPSNSKNPRITNARSPNKRGGRRRASRAAAGRRAAAPRARVDAARPTPRSAAQQQASRRNGSASRGPVTLEGKSKSRMNALRHGLLARKISPPGDSREDDRLFRRLRSELEEEYRPKGCTAKIWLDCVASEMVQLCRARAMVEAHQCPVGVTSSDEDAWRRVADWRKQERLLARLCEAPDDARHRSAWSDDSAERAAGILTKQLGEVLAEVALGAKEEGAGDLDDDDRAELLPFRELAEQVGPARERLLDVAYVAEVLRGRKRGELGDDERLRLLAQHGVKVMRRSIAIHAGAEDRLRRLQSEALASKADAPEKLMTLARYVRQLESSIDEKLRQLRRE